MSERLSFPPFHLPSFILPSVTFVRPRNACKQRLLRILTCHRGEETGKQEAPFGRSHALAPPFLVPREKSPPYMERCLPITVRHAGIRFSGSERRTRLASLPVHTPAQLAWAVANQRAEVQATGELLEVPPAKTHQEAVGQNANPRAFVPFPFWWF